jgi:hypothetical protein
MGLINGRFLRLCCSVLLLVHSTSFSLAPGEDKRAIYRDDRRESWESLRDIGRVREDKEEYPSKSIGFNESILTEIERNKEMSVSGMIIPGHRFD